MTVAAVPSAARPLDRGPPRPARVAFREFAGLEGLERIRPEWQHVLSGLDHPHFAHFPEWHGAFARHLADDPRSLRFYVGYDGDVPVAVFPLAAGSRRVGGVPVRSLEFATDGVLLSCDVVFATMAENVSLVAQFVEHLREASSAWDVLVLRNLLVHSAGWFSLGAIPPPRTIVEPGDACDYLPCVVPERRLAALSKSVRAGLWRARRRLAQERGVEFVRARGPAEIASAFQEFLAVEGSGWKAARGSAIRFDERRTAFYGAVLRDFAALGRAEINLLRVEGRPIAAQLCLSVDRRLYVLKIGYDEAYARLAPGNLLREHVLERCSLEGDVDEVNLLSDAPHHAGWRCRTYLRWSGFVFNDSARGLVSLCALRAKRLLRPAVRRFRSTLGAARTGARGTR